jgi:hypothetical protein
MNYANTTKSGNMDVIKIVKAFQHVERYYILALIAFGLVGNMLSLRIFYLKKRK